MLKYKKSKGR